MAKEVPNQKENRRSTALYCTATERKQTKSYRYVIKCTLYLLVIFHIRKWYLTNYIIFNGVPIYIF